MLFASEFGGEINHEKERLNYGVAYEILHFKSGLSVLALKRSHGTGGYITAPFEECKRGGEDERGRGMDCSLMFSSLFYILSDRCLLFCSKLNLVLRESGTLLGADEARPSLRTATQSSM